VVTGGASGLGRGVVETIARANGKVFVLDINQDAGQALADAYPESVHFLSTDVQDAEQVDAHVREAAERMGGLNLAVNCAGVLGNGRLLGKNGPMDPAFFARVIHINLIGAFHLSRSAAAVMATQPTNASGERGVIVHTASIAAFEGQFGQVAYSASKAGVVGMLLPMARELARSGIRVMGIAPGMFETPMLENLSDDIRAQLAAGIPFPSRFGKPEEFAALVRHIFENPMLNGTVIRLDGAARLQ
ncbi:MAG: SDR family NAD(P)-dependent oxidoreductase, partial [Gammaproteobacteria bacterium]